MMVPHRPSYKSAKWEVARAAGPDALQEWIIGTTARLQQEFQERNVVPVEWQTRRVNEYVIVRVNPGDGSATVEFIVDGFQKFKTEHTRIIIRLVQSQNFLVTIHVKYRGPNDAVIAGPWTTRLVPLQLPLSPAYAPQQRAYAQPPPPPPPPSSSSSSSSAPQALIKRRVPLLSVATTATTTATTTTASAVTSTVSAVPVLMEVIAAAPITAIVAAEHVVANVVSNVAAAPARILAPASSNTGWFRGTYENDTELNRLHVATANDTKFSGALREFIDAYSNVALAPIEYAAGYDAWSNYAQVEVDAFEWDYVKEELADPDEKDAFDKYVRFQEAIELLRKTWSELDYDPEAKITFTRDEMLKMKKSPSSMMDPIAKEVQRVVRFLLP